MLDDDAKTCSLEIERRLGVPTLAELLNHADAIGVGRLIVTPSYSRDASIRTVTFFGSHFFASLVLRSKIDQTEIASAPVYECRETEVSFGRARLPELFSSWPSLHDVAVRADSHSSVVFTDDLVHGVASGGSYIHRLFDHDSEHTARWDAPRMPYHVSQTGIVAAYYKLFDDLNLFPERRMTRTQRRRKQRLNAERRKAKAWKKRRRG